MADIDFQLQGSFTSTGLTTTLEIDCGVDWIEVINYTQAATQQATGRGVKFYWQNGMPQGGGLIYTKTNSTDALNLDIMSSGGFTILPSDTYLGPAVTGTTITKANPAVATAAGHGFSNGDVVLLSNLTNMPQLANVYFTIGGVTTNTFTLAYMNTNTANFTAETGFTVRKVYIPNPWNPIGSIPTAMTVSGQTLAAIMSQDITQAGFAVSQIVRLLIPAGFGMTQANEVSGQVTAVNTSTNTITLSNFIFTDGSVPNLATWSAFAWPANTAFPNQLPQAIPYGAGNIFPEQTAPDSVFNNTINGIMLGAGVNGPAGSSSDVIYWRAGKSFDVYNV